MNKKESRIKLLISNMKFTRIVAALVGLLFIFQLIYYAHSQVPILDEGLYLLKGFLYATGEYQPFQDYGPWTNHMPLSYLVPGYIQAWFTPGIRTGRYLSIVIGALFFLGIWEVGKRFGGRWGGILAISALAFNPALIKIYSVSASQGLVAFMLVWIIFLTVGGDRPKWQIILGTFLSGLIVLTRMNMAPVFLLVVAYVFWEYGRRIGGWGLLSGLLPLTIAHIYYWPGIMTLWAKWLPIGLTPFLDAFRLQEIGLPVWQPEFDVYNRLISFIEGVRYHFVSLIGFIAFTITSSLKTRTRKNEFYKSEVFLGVLFMALFAGHLWASLGKDFCVFCYSAYLSFFSYIGIFLLILSFGRLFTKITEWRLKFISLVIFTICIGIALSNFESFSSKVFTDPYVRSLMLKTVPRFGGMRIRPGGIPLWGLLENIYGWNYQQIHRNIQRALSFGSAFLSGIAFSVLVIYISHRLTPLIGRFMGLTGKALDYRPISLIILVLSGLLLSPTKILAGDRYQYDCGLGVINSYEDSGATLSEIIAPGTSVYWRGGLSPALLLYLKAPKIYPAQLNANYSFRDGGDLDALVKYGLWNQSLARIWAQAADIILISERNYHGWLAEMVVSNNFTELTPTELVVPCQKDSSIHIFRRVP